MQDHRPRVVIIGGGFGGVAAARRLKGENVDVVLIDRRNHNIFQPLLYQVATAVLAPSDVAAPIRQLARRQPNLTVLMGEVTGIDLSARTITTTCVEASEFKQRFDYLVVAAGMRPSYFGHDEFAARAPSLKTISDAETIRTKILTAFELAELTSDPAERARQMTFVLVGAGPTGVELAASIAQMTTVTLRSNFRKIDPAKAAILLLDGGKRVLPSFHESLSAKAAKHLAQIGVEVRTGTLVENITERGVIVGGKLIESATVLWTPAWNLRQSLSHFHLSRIAQAGSVSAPLWSRQISAECLSSATLAPFRRTAVRCLALRKWLFSRATSWVATLRHKRQEGSSLSHSDISTRGIWQSSGRISRSWKPAGFVLVVSSAILLGR